MMELESLTKEVCRLARETGNFLRAEAAGFDISRVEYKGLNNLVSYVDRAAEERIVKELKRLLPDSGFITEEGTVEQSDNASYRWVIDPLDGTTNFTHGIPCFCVSIALLRDMHPVLGVVYEVNRDECFWTFEGAPAFMNEKRIQVSQALRLSEALIATGFPYTNYGRMKEYMQVFDYCMRNTHGLRRLGSAAVDLAWVACGRFEAFYEYGLNSWDVAAGGLLVQQAGGIVTDFNGKDGWVFSKEILAANASIHPEFLKVIGNFFSGAVHGTTTP